MIRPSLLDWWVELGSSGVAAALLLWRAMRPPRPRRDDDES